MAQDPVPAPGQDGEPPQPGDAACDGTPDSLAPPPAADPPPTVVGPPPDGADDYDADADLAR
ncbi:MAG TPA: hypothetical protein VNV62_23260 [Trebonia sp.]|jgi:hypothetical protein|nr:hypothetical protein [Trebonia sp.]